MTLPEPAEPERFNPQKYGRYVLLERIGQGGMAEVFRAVARGTQGFQRILVVKRILPEMCRDPKFVQMFVDEAKISALISHPNVVQTYEFGKIGDTHFITMEFVHGRNLSAVMTKLAELGRMPPPDIVAEIMRQAALGLNHAHAMTNAEGKPLGIIHRDVTPANIMVAFNGAVKVLDFGIARAAEEIKETRTQAGTVKGKVAYLAPEQIKRAPVDHRSDIFAMGVVLHECLSARRLFKADNPLAAMKAILDEPIPSASSLNPAVPEALDRIVAKALARDPDKRYQSGKALALDLEAALHEMKYFSQRLPNFLKEIFREEITRTKDLLLPKEIEALALGEKGDGAPPPIPAAVARASLNAKDPSDATGDLSLDMIDAPPRPRWANPKLLAGGGLALGAIVAVFFILVRPGGSTEATQGPKPTSKSVESRPAAPPKAEEMPPLPETVKIVIHSDPQGATVIDPDGDTLGTTPAAISFTRGVAEQGLKVVLKGHKDGGISFVPDEDKPLFVKLKKRGGGKKARAKSSGGAMPVDPFAD
jgi:serine/threonine-protein kinase